MYFFITTKIDSTPSAIELAMMNRQRLFKAHGVPSIILTRNFVRDLHTNMQKVGLADESVINMYDFFQGTTNVSTRSMTIDDYPLAPGEELVKISSIQYDVVQRGLYQKIILINSLGQVDYVNILNPQGKTSRRDYYDTRGFLSVSQYFDKDDNIVLEQLYNHDRRPVMETYFRPNVQGQVTAVHQCLINYQGRDYEFEDWNQLTAFFLDAVNEQYGLDNIMMVDRSDAGMYPLVQMQTPARKYEILHSNFTVDPVDVEHSAIVPLTQIALDHAQQMTGFIMATVDECHDMSKRINYSVPTIPIPVGFVDDSQLNQRVTFDSRTPGKIIAVARLSAEKQLDQVIKAVAEVHSKLPIVSLDIYGYGDAWTGFKESNKLRALVKDNGWSDFVNFAGFKHDLTSIYNSAQIMTLTSIHEGFNLGILEGLSHGVPVIAYDIKYGPADMITDGKNGRLLPPNDWHRLARELLKLLEDPRKLSEMSSAAYDLSAHFSADAVWDKWEQQIIQPDVEAMRGNE